MVTKMKSIIAGILYPIIGYGVAKELYRWLEDSREKNPKAFVGEPSGASMLLFYMVIWPLPAILMAWPLIANALFLRDKESIMRINANVIIIASFIVLFVYCVLS